MNKMIATLLLAVPLSFAAQTAPVTAPAPTAPVQKTQKVKKVKVHKAKKAPKTAKHLAKSHVKKA